MFSYLVGVCMKKMKSGLIGFVMLLSSILSGHAAAQTDGLQNTWGSAGFLVGAAQSGKINETGVVLGGFGYGVQNDLMIGGEGYVFASGGIKGAIVMVNVGFAFDDWVQGKSRRVLIPYVGFGGGSIESRDNSQKTDSGVFVSAGLQYRLKIDRHSFGFRASVMRGDRAPLWVLGVTME